MVSRKSLVAPMRPRFAAVQPSFAPLQHVLGPHAPDYLLHPFLNILGNFEVLDPCSKHSVSHTYREIRLQITVKFAPSRSPPPNLPKIALVPVGSGRGRAKAPNPTSSGHYMNHTQVKVCLQRRKKRTRPLPKENHLGNFSGRKEKLSRPVVDIKTL